jgi:uncharacterized protein (TIGR03083 family)
VADGTGLAALGPVDVLDLLVPERGALCELMDGLGPDDWARPTECPAWTVQGVALHVLGDDLSLLSRQRDAQVPSLLTEGSLPTWDGAPGPILDRFNERWVHAATFLSPRALIDLLRWSGTASHEWYSTVDPDSTGEPVLLFGMQAAPYRYIAAREFLERWVHQLQIRRALDLGAGPLGRGPLAARGIEVVARAVATLVALVMPSTDMSLTIAFGDEVYTYVHDPSGEPAIPHGWAPRPGAAADATVTIAIDPAEVVTLVSRGLDRPRAETALVVRAGDGALGHRLVDAMAATMSAYYPDL